MNLPKNYKKSKELKLIKNVSERSDIVIFSGDLNYRING